ncbi:MAG: nickel pincer cofactor biosynthesis protein LarB [Oscillospiraceae bacterium]|jgi:NCAIR mutase (PurE)-related protein|nr:nickel pincer cofactor biosynthesis protein LarB [Oscillospiraceae bacterium]
MELIDILAKVQSGDLDPAAAAELINAAAPPAYDDLGYAVVDHDRRSRTGAAEVIYCAGKTPEQIVGIMRNMISRGTDNILATRASQETFDFVCSAIPDAEYFAPARIIALTRKSEPKRGPRVLVVCAGTSDIPVAEEARVTADFLGCDVQGIYDVGVAGLHRLLARLGDLRGAGVIIVVAGMEGALASVVAGLTPCPVIAVPTSVGYGASFGGIAALLAMLNSCASGVGVVNIDNGFGAAMLASHIVNLTAEK